MSKSPSLNEEITYKLLRLLESNPQISQRDLAKQLGVSLGKANYCLRALVDKGFVKASNFRNNRNKSAYIYLLTPSGIEEKGRVALRFLRRKMDEYELLRVEIARLSDEISAASGGENSA